jgi:hypothetical protein
MESGVARRAPHDRPSIVPRRRSRGPVSQRCRPRSMPALWHVRLLHGTTDAIPCSGSTVLPWQSPRVASASNNRDAKAGSVRRGAIRAAATAQVGSQPLPSRGAAQGRWVTATRRGLSIWAVTNAAYLVLGAIGQALRRAAVATPTRRPRPGPFGCSPGATLANSWKLRGTATSGRTTTRCRWRSFLGIHWRDAG